MEIYYDTEFLENGVTIRFLSIGMVREDGKEYYAITQDLSVISAAAREPWLKENVLDKFPLAQPVASAYPVFDPTHPDFENVKPKSTIAREVYDFIASALPDVSLWAWFSSYDHVVLAQLFGRMIDLPIGIPMYTNDLRSEVERLGNPWVPELPGSSAHNALHDAREVKFRREWLKQNKGSL